LGVGLSDKDMGYKTLLQDPRVQASLRRLKAMGLIVETELLDVDTVVIAVDMDSVDRYIERTLYANITYPNKYVYLEPSTRTLLIFISRSASRIKEISQKYKREEDKLIEQLAKIQKGEK
jgi:hypothetical protein